MMNNSQESRRSSKLTQDADFIPEIFSIVSFCKGKITQLFELTALLIAPKFMKFAKITLLFPLFLTKNIKPSSNIKLKNTTSKSCGTVSCLNSIDVLSNTVHHWKEDNL